MPAVTRRLPPERLALLLAAVVALVAIGIAVARSTGAFDAKPPAAPQAAAAATSPDDAIAGLEARLKANPDNVGDWQMLGWSFFETGRYAEAATAYKRATALAPNNATLWSSLGEALAMDTQKPEMPADASAAFKRALALDANDPRARYFAGVEKDLSGNAKGAIDDWIGLLEITPAGAPWEASVRDTIRKVGEREKIDVATRLAAVKPAPAPLTPATAAIPGPSREQMAAAARLPQGQQEAMVAGMVDGLENKLKANPANPQGWIMLMRSRMTLGDASRAGEAYRKAVAANPAARAQLSAAAKELGVPGA